MGFVRKATIISTGGLARAGGLKGTSKKERDAKANEKMAKIEDKRFKAEQRAAKAQQRAVKAEHRAAMAETAIVRTAVLSEAIPISTQTSAATAGTPPQTAQGPPPGWYLDPDDGSLQRWWDGNGWTEVKQAAAAEPPPLSSAP